MQLACILAPLLAASAALTRDQALKLFAEWSASDDDVKTFDWPLEVDCSAMNSDRLCYDECMYHCAQPWRDRATDEDGSIMYDSSALVFEACERALPPRCGAIYRGIRAVRARLTSPLGGSGGSTPDLARRVAAGETENVDNGWAGVYLDSEGVYYAGTDRTIDFAPFVARVSEIMSKQPNVQFVNTMMLFYIDDGTGPEEHPFALSLDKREPVYIPQPEGVDELMMAEGGRLGHTFLIGGRKGLGIDATAEKEYVAFESNFSPSGHARPLYAWELYQGLVDDWALEAIKNWQVIPLAPDFVASDVRYKTSTSDGMDQVTNTLKAHIVIPHLRRSIDGHRLQREVDLPSVPILFISVWDKSLTGAVVPHTKSASDKARFISPHDDFGYPMPRATQSCLGEVSCERCASRSTSRGTSCQWCMTPGGQGCHAQCNNAFAIPVSCSSA